MLEGFSFAFRAKTEECMSCKIIFLAEIQLCLSLHFAFSLARTVSFLSKYNCKEVLAVRTSYRKEVLALLSCNRKEVLAVSRTQAQVTRNQPQEELLLADAKRSSCVCIIFGLYCSSNNLNGFSIHVRPN